MPSKNHLEQFDEEELRHNLAIYQRMVILMAKDLTSYNPNKALYKADMEETIDFYFYQANQLMEKDMPKAETIAIPMGDRPKNLKG